VIIISQLLLNFLNSCKKRQNLTLLNRDTDLFKVIVEVLLSCCCLFVHWRYYGCFITNIVRTWTYYI